VVSTRKRPWELVRCFQLCLLMHRGKLHVVKMVAAFATYFVWAIYFFVAGKCDVLGCGPGRFYKWVETLWFWSLTHLNEVWRQVWLLVGRRLVITLFVYLADRWLMRACVAYWFAAKERVEFRHNYHITVFKNRLLLAPLTLQLPPLSPVEETDNVYTEYLVPFYLYSRPLTYELNSFPTRAGRNSSWS
jgi:hypothetical protein